MFFLSKNYVFFSKDDGISCKNYGFPCKNDGFLALKANKMTFSIDVGDRHSVVDDVRTSGKGLLA